MKQMNACRLLAFLSLLAGLDSCTQGQPSDGYEINGSITGVPSGKVRLIATNTDDRTTKNIDSADVSSGVFTLKGKLAAPEMMTLTVEPGGWSMPVFVENSRISIKADTTGSRHYDWTAYGGSKGAELTTYSVSGSENGDISKKYDNDPSLKVFEPVFAALQKEYTAAGSNKEEEYKIKNQMDSVRKLLTAVQLKWIDSFVRVNPSAPAGAYLLSNYYLFNSDMPLQQMDSLMGAFTGPAKSTVYFTRLSAAVAKRKALQPGNPAPDFTLRKADSSSLTLSSLRGRYVMLDFWASWCVPCRKAIPHWKEVYKKYHPKGFEILSITDDSRWSDWTKALQQEKMPWLQVADEFPIKNMPARVGTLYMTPYLPCYILLDKEGKIVLHNPGEDEMDKKLKEIFGS